MAPSDCSVWKGRSIQQTPVDEWPWHACAPLQASCQVVLLVTSFPWDSDLQTTIGLWPAPIYSQVKGWKWSVCIHVELQNHLWHQAPRRLENYSESTRFELSLWNFSLFYKETQFRKTDYSLAEHKCKRKWEILKSGNLPRLWRRGLIMGKYNSVTAAHSLAPSVLTNAFVTYHTV